MMADEKRLTWKQSIDGYTDVGLRPGVTVGDALGKAVACLRSVQ